MKPFKKRTHHLIECDFFILLLTAVMWDNGIRREARTRRREWKRKRRGLLRTMAQVSRAIWGLFILSLPHTPAAHCLFIHFTSVIQEGARTSKTGPTCECVGRNMHTLSKHKHLVQNIERFLNSVNYICCAQFNPIQLFFFWLWLQCGWERIDLMSVKGGGEKIFIDVRLVHLNNEWHLVARSRAGDEIFTVTQRVKEQRDLVWSNEYK